jgi:hypothetical protein
VSVIHGWEVEARLAREDQLRQRIETLEPLERAACEFVRAVGPGWLVRDDQPAHVRELWTELVECVTG